MSSEEPRVRMVVSALVALVLTVLPLPGPKELDLFRPSFLVLTVLYWSIAAPRAGGVGFGWFCGLLLDVFHGPVLGEHALVLCMATGITAHEHQKIRTKPAFQQALIVLVILAFYEVVLFIIDGWAGHAVTTPTRWIHCVTGAVIWPLAAAILSGGRRS
jgi:rod shape-determining protein MreD